MSVKLTMEPPANPSAKDFVRWLTDQPSVVRRLRDLTNEAWKRAVPDGQSPLHFAPAEDAAAKRARQYLCSMAEKYERGEPRERPSWVPNPNGPSDPRPLPESVA